MKNISEEDPQVPFLLRNGFKASVQGAYYLLASRISSVQSGLSSQAWPWIVILIWVGEMSGTPPDVEASSSGILISPFFGAALFGDLRRDSGPLRGSPGSLPTVCTPRPHAALFTSLTSVSSVSELGQRVPTLPVGWV